MAENDKEKEGAPDAKEEAGLHAGTLEVKDAPGKDEQTVENPIWDRNNVLVDEELSKHFAEESEKVLGLRPAVDSKERKATEKNEDVEASTAQIDHNSAWVSQQNPSQTRDVMTSPPQINDPNTKPTQLTTMTEEQAAYDQAVVDSAAKITEKQREEAVAETEERAERSVAASPDRTPESLDDATSGTDAVENPEKAPTKKNGGTKPPPTE